MKNYSLGPAWIVLIAFVVAVIALVVASAIGASGPALTGLRASVVLLAGNIGNAIAHYMGRKHDEKPGERCPLCKGTFPDLESFTTHAVQMHGATSVLETPPPAE